MHISTWKALQPDERMLFSKQIGSTHIVMLIQQGWDAFGLSRASQLNHGMAWHGMVEAPYSVDFFSLISHAASLTLGWPK